DSLRAFVVLPSRANLIRVCFEAGGCTHPQSIHYSWKGVEMRGRAFRPLSNCLDVSRSIVRDEAVEPMDWRRRLPLRLSNFMLPQQSAVDRGMKTRDRLQTATDANSRPAAAATSRRCSTRNVHPAAQPW